MQKFVLLLFILSLAPKLQGQEPGDSCKLIGAENGLRVRKGPGIEEEVIGHLPYGALVKILDDSVKVKGIVKDGNKELEGNWTAISYDERFTMEGYVFDAYLVDHLKEIPMQSLYYYYSFSSNRLLENGEYENLEIDFYNSSFYAMDPSYMTDKCIPRYTPNFTNPLINRKEMSYDSPILATIYDYVKLSFVNESVLNYYQANHPENKYEITRNIEPKNLAELEWKNRFYVPIKGGQDSVLVEDYEGEGYVSKTYLGEIEELNIHLIHNQYEDAWVTSIDKDTGEEENFAYGLPFVSPNREYLLTFDLDYFSEASYMGITKYNENRDELLYLSIGFKSWTPKFDLNSAFWISENELIFEACPIDNMVGSDGGSEMHYQYLKVTILR